MASIIDSQELKSIVNGINQKDSLLNVDQTTENLRGSEVDQNNDQAPRTSIPTITSTLGFLKSP
jgi:hypothetical protein